MARASKVLLWRHQALCGSSAPPFPWVPQQEAGRAPAIETCSQVALEASPHPWPWGDCIVVSALPWPECLSLTRRRFLELTAGLLWLAVLVITESWASSVTGPSADGVHSALEPRGTSSAHGPGSLLFISAAGLCPPAWKQPKKLWAQAQGCRCSLGMDRDISLYFKTRCLVSTGSVSCLVPTQKCEAWSLCLEIPQEGRKAAFVPVFRRSFSEGKHNDVV